MASKCMKRCSTSPGTRKMHVKTTVRSHFTPMRVARIKKSDRSKCGGDVEKQNPWQIVGGNVEWHSCWEKVWQFLGKIKIE